MPMLDQAAAQQQPVPEQEAPAPAGPQASRAPRGDLSDMNTPASPNKGKGVADSYTRRSKGLMAEEEEATEEEQAELDRALGALSKVLYEDDNTSQSIQDQLRPEERIGSIAKASILLIQQLDEKLDLDEVVIAEFTQEVADRVIDMYEAKNDEEVTDEDAQKVLGATWEGVQELFGVDEDSYEEMTQGMGEEDINQYTQQYKQFLGE